jgi:Tfp pilus assembly protein PilF
MEKIKKLQSFLRDTPDDPFLKHALALEYIKLGNNTVARDLLIELLTADPSYIGSYYHLAQLLERAGELQIARIWYEKGMIASKNAGDLHTYSELQAAYENLIE